MHIETLAPKDAIYQVGDNKAPAVGKVSMLMGSGAAGIKGNFFLGDWTEDFFFLGKAVVKAQLLFVAFCLGYLLGTKERGT